MKMSNTNNESKKTNESPINEDYTPASVKMMLWGAPIIGVVFLGLYLTGYIK